MAQLKFRNKPLRIYTIEFEVNYVGQGWGPGDTYACLTEKSYKDTLKNLRSNKDIRNVKGSVFGIIKTD